jgi:asparagine synthase (glutamine-hydrolysing)
MKLQLGLLHTDGKPATTDDLAVLLGEFGATQAETSGEIVDGPLIVAYRGDRITHEEDSEIQPLQRGPHLLTWDGRLDNREALADRLGLKHVQGISDPTIVLRAYEAFGRSAFRDLIGEFALALWCNRTRRLLFARSHCGARPLYYTVTKGTLFWSSDFAHLVRISSVDLDVNENYLLEYLLSQPSTAHTPLTRVDVVAANSTVQLENGLVLLKEQLWNPEGVSPLSYHSDHEYEACLREKLTEAVRVRIRAKSPVFAELSGGLDSSSIVLTADDCFKRNGEPSKTLKTLSCVYEESETCDERKFIKAIEEARGIETLLVSEKEQRTTLGLCNPEFTGLPNPLHCWPGRYQTFSLHMKANGARVLLTGLGGDHLFWSAPEGAPLVAEQLRAWNPWGAHRECRTWSRAACIPYLQLMSKSLVSAVRGPYEWIEAPTWLGESVRRSPFRSNLSESGRKNVSASRQAQMFSVDLLSRTIGAGYFNEYCDLYISHPYTHRPLVEFCLAAPLSQFLRGGQTRSLMRRAFVDTLPPKINRRLSKATVDETLIRALQREWSQNSDLSRWEVCQREFVDSDQLSHSLDHMRLGREHLSGPLIRLFSLERWLRSLRRWPAMQGKDGGFIMSARAS